MSHTPYTLDRARGFFRSAPFMVDLGVEPVAIGEGFIDTVIELQPRHLQHLGHVHAGVIASLADHSMGAAAQTRAPDGRWAVTAEFKLTLMRAAVGQRLICHATVLRAGRTLTFTEAEVHTETGAERTLVAKASGTMALVTAKT